VYAPASAERAAAATSRRAAGVEPAATRLAVAATSRRGLAAAAGLEPRPARGRAAARLGYAAAALGLEPGPARGRATAPASRLGRAVAGCAAGM